MKRDLKFKVIFGISALSLTSGFNSSVTGLHLEEKKINCELSNERETEERFKKINVTKNKQLLPRINKILKVVPKLIINYSISAVAGLLMLYVTDKVSMKLLNVKATDYIGNLFR